MKIADRIIESIPFLKIFYRTSRQVIELISIQKASSSLRPVLVEYPSKDMWMIAFYTGPAGKVLSPEAETLHTVFIPAAPNPTNGFLCILPSVKIRPLAISMQQAVKVIFTGGMVKQ
jgi:uncharacterized membrane protein